VVDSQGATAQAIGIVTVVNTNFALSLNIPDMTLLAGDTGTGQFTFTPDPDVASPVAFAWLTLVLLCLIPLVVGCGGSKSTARLRVFRKSP